MEGADAEVENLRHRVAQLEHDKKDLEAKVQELQERIDLNLIVQTELPFEGRVKLQQGLDIEEQLQRLDHHVVEQPQEANTGRVHISQKQSSCNMFRDEPPEYEHPRNKIFVQGYEEQFGLKSPIQFSVDCMAPGSRFTGQGRDSAGHFDVFGSVTEASFEMTKRYADYEIGYRGILKAKDAAINGTFSMLPWGISGGDTFEFQYFEE